MSQDAVKTKAHPELRVKAGLRAPEHEVPAEPEEPPREEIPRIVRLLALAHRWHRLIDEGQVESQAEIARRVGLTRARVTQIMNLRWLSPVVQERLISVEIPSAGLRELRAIACTVVWWGKSQSEIL